MAVTQRCHQTDIEKLSIVYVNSYHRGHPSSDEIMDAVIEYFPPDSFQFTSYMMDTKRNTAQRFIENRAAQLFDSILLIKPDIVIVSDDNAVKYLVQPHLSKTPVPVVFCGVNWSDQDYTLQPNQITGMLEILPLRKALLLMKSYYPSMDQLLVLTENTTTSRKEEMMLDTLFTNIGINATHALVDNFEAWKKFYEDGNKMFDIIYIPTNGGIKNWDHEEALDFAKQHMKVPVITCEDFMMPFASVGLTKVASEQGIWAAQTARKILSGQSPKDFSVVRNQKSVLWYNEELSEKIQFQPDKEFLSKATIVKE